MQSYVILIVFGFLVKLALGIPFETSYSDGYDVNNRIVGGTDAPPGSEPHMVALVYGTFSRIHVCGASIITTEHVMTAAHCIDAVRTVTGLEPSLKGVIGTNIWHDERNTVNFTHHAIHPKWNSRLIKYDIGILYVHGEIPLGPNVAVLPIKLGFVGGGVVSKVSGWGLTEWGGTSKLQVLTTNTLSPGDCTQRLANLPSNIPYDPAVEICTWHSVGHGNCYGDSGSALYEKETGCQTAIVSWGFPCAVIGPDMYTRLSGVIDFILASLGNHHVRFCK